ncbi:HD domain-containing protein [Thalassospiraceae bacterium LMO-JJ14]|nr:HD domain-containing protein [Thalassospiraceae bacterium LMO-JJ14]
MKRLRNALINRKDVVSGRIIVNILDKADSDGLMHGIAVAEVASIIGKQSGIGERGQSELWLEGLLHDIGKLGVPSEVLHRKKPSPADLQYMQKHVTIGKFITDRLFSGGSLGRVIEAHHECYDGSGYPHGLAGEEIPLDARILAIADYYDAARSAGWILTHRTHDAVISEIVAKQGKVFDPVFAEAAAKASSSIQAAHEAVHATTHDDLAKWL